MEQAAVRHDATAASLEAMHGPEVARAYRRQAFVARERAAQERRLALEFAELQSSAQML